MTDHDALLAAICANPDEDTPRLVYADFLEENGEAERAAFIRAQVELARTPAWEPFAVLCRWRRTDWEVGKPFRHTLPTVDGFHLEWHPAAFGRGLGWRMNVRSLIAWEQMTPRFLECAPIGEVHLWGATLDDWRQFARSPLIPRLRRVHFVSSPIEPLRVLRETPEALGITDVFLDRASGAGTPVVVEDLLQSPLGRVVRGLHLHVGYESLNELCDALNSGEQTRLERLSLTTMGLTADHVPRLFEGPLSRVLSELNLRDNPLGSDGGESVGRYLPHGIQALDLAGTGLGKRGLETLATSSAASTLRSLNLSRNPLTPRAARVLSRSSYVAGLRSLDLSQCRVGTRELHHLTRAKFWLSLVELNLRWNPIPGDGIRKLLDAPVPPDLTALLLDTPQVGSEAKKALQRKYGERIVFTQPGT